LNGKTVGGQNRAGYGRPSGKGEMRRGGFHTGLGGSVFEKGEKRKLGGPEEEHWGSEGDLWESGALTIRHQIFMCRRGRGSGGSGL